VAVQPGRLTDLSELLTRAKALAADLDSVEDTTEIGERPSFLVAQPRNDPQPIIERLASAKSLTFEPGNPRTGIRVVADRAPLREDARAAFCERVEEGHLRHQEPHPATAPRRSAGREARQVVP
jgi:hypothetical protein